MTVSPADPVLARPGAVLRGAALRGAVWAGAVLAGGASAWGADGPIRLTPGVPSVIVPSPVVPAPEPPVSISPAPESSPPASPAPSSAPPPDPAPPLLRPTAPAPRLSDDPIPPRVDEPISDLYPTAPPGAAFIRPGAVSAAPLGAPEPDGLGLIPPGEGGMTAALWSGLSRGEAMAHLARVPVGGPSLAVRGLFRRLLLAEAIPPAVPEGEMMPARRFGAVRVETLAALGDPDAARALADRIPGVLTDEATARAVVDAGFVAGKPDCAGALDLAKGFRTVYWRRVEVYCRSLSGDRAGAELALSMLQDKGGSDTLGLRLAEAMVAGMPAAAPPGEGSDSGGDSGAAPRSGAAPPVLTVAPHDPPVITLAMMGALNVPVPVETLKTLGPARLAVAARNGATDPLLRVTAAERAAQSGYLDAKALSDAYAAVPAPAEEMARLETVARKERTPRMRALVGQGLMGAMAGNRRVAMVNLMLNQLDPPMLAGAVGAVTATMLDTVTPGPDSASIAPGAVRVYLSQGRQDAARRWLDLAGRTAGPRMRPLAAVMGASIDTRGWGGPWLDAVLKGADEAAAERAAGVVAVLAAAGADVAPEIRNRLPDPPPAAGEGFERLDAAVAERQQGAVVLAALQILGRSGPSMAPLPAVARVVSALNAVGLSADALALAREALAAQVR